MLPLLVFGPGSQAQIFSAAPGGPWAQGRYARSLVAADFNGDGRADLAVVNRLPNSVTVLLGNGSGGFTEATGSPFALSNLAISISAGDFNGDGKMDLVTANYGSGTISVFLGNGAGGFTSAGSPVAAGTNPSQIAIADFNGDGKQDLAIADTGGGVTILLGNGGGGFTPAASSPLAAGTNPEWVAAGDFNGDGKTDLAAANYGSNNVTVLLGNGSGGFSPAAHSPFSVGKFPYSVVVSDFNGDGKQDLATANGDATISVLAGDGTGNFTQPAGSPYAAAGTPEDIVAVDFNGDGNVDLITANWTGGNLTLLQGNGDGTFAAASGSPLAVESGLETGAGSASIAIADFNGDGKPDIAAAVADGTTPANSNVTALLNVLPALSLAVGETQFLAAQGQSGGSPSTTFSVSSGTGPSAAIAVSSSQPSWLGVYPAGGSTGSSLAGYIYVSNTVPGTYSGIIRANAPGYFGSSVTIVERVTAKAGTLLPAAGSPFNAGVGNRAIATADFNLDGNVDLVTGGGGTGQLSVLLGNGSGGFSAAPTSPFGSNMDPAAIVTGDFNNDGRPDIAVANASLNTVSVWLGNGAGGFSAAPGSPFSVGAQPSAIGAGDFNGDGNIDLAVANKGGNTVSILLGNGLGTFIAAAGSPVAVGSQPLSLAISDFNGDGHPDIAVANFGSSNLTILLGSGAGAFSPTAASPIAMSKAPWGVLATDINYDGHPDLAVTSSSAIACLFGDGAGGFAPGVIPSQTVTNGIAQNALAAGDFNGDGSVDVAMATGATNMVAIEMGYTHQVLAFGDVDFSAGAGPAGVAVADFNGDGRDDLAVVNATDGTVSVMLGAQATVTVSIGLPASVTYDQFSGGNVSVSSTMPFFSETLGEDGVSVVADGTVPVPVGPALGGALFLELDISPILGAGAHTLVGSIAESGRFHAASSGPIPLQIAQEPQTITFSLLPTAVLGTGPVSVTASASSGLPVSISSTTPSVCTLAGGKLTLVAAGTCSATGTQAGNANYAAAPAATASFKVRPPVGTQAQTISFTSPTFTAPVGNLQLGTNASVSATASSGLAVSVVSTTVGVCHVSAGMAITTSAGICSLTASQAGNSTYAAANPVQHSFPVGDLATGGYFTTQASPYNSAAVYSVITADFTGDGKQDIAFLNTTGNVVTVLPGDGNGGFGAAITSPSAAANSLVAGDFNGDGFMDLIALGAGTATPLINNGAGGFTSGNQFTFSTGSNVNANGVATDLNGDGLLDLVVADDTAHVAVFLGDGTGSFGATAAGSFALPTGGTTGVGLSLAAAGDFNGDGKPDIAIAASIGHELCILTGDGTGNLTATAASPYALSGPTTTGLGVADFNNDGVPDVVVGSGTGISVFLNNGNAAFTPAAGSPAFASDSPAALLVGDFDGDGNMDVVSANPNASTYSLTFLVGDGRGGLSAAGVESYARIRSAFVSSLAGGDFNNDGRPDLAIGSNSPGFVNVLLGGAVPTATTIGGATSVSYGAGASISATVTESQTAFQPLTGTVSFSIDGGAATAVNLAGATAAFTIPAQTSGGMHTVTANYSGAGGIAPSSGSITLQISPVAQTITFAPLSNQTFGAPAFALIASASSGLTVSFASNTPSVCTVSAATVTLVSAGTCSIAASQAGNANYSAAAAVTRTFTVAQASQTITFGALSAVTLPAAAFNVTATASSGLAVTFASTTASVCTVSGSSVTPLAAGTCSIVASQTGNSSYLAAAPVTQSFTVTQGTQSITVGTLLNWPFGSRIALSVSASSGLPVTVVSNTATVCTVSAGYIVPVSVGSCSITASQAGNANWGAAAPVTQTFQITQGTQTITFGALAAVTLPAAPFALTATATSGLPVSFASTTSSVCTVSGTSVTPLAAGTCTIVASQAGNTNYAAASSVTQSFTVNAAATAPSGGGGGGGSAPAGGGASVTSSPTSVTIAAPVGGGTASQTVTFSFQTYTQGAPSFTTNTTYNSGYGWLSVSPATGTMTQASYAGFLYTYTATVTITGNSTGFATGSSYSGTVNFSAGGGIASIPVTMNVTAQPAVFTVAPQALSFVYRVGDPAGPPAQSLAVFSTPSGSMFTSAAASGANWVSANGTGSTPSSVGVSVNVSGIGAGTYLSKVTITPASGTPINVPVTLTVVQASPQLSVSSGVESVTAAQGGSPANGQIAVSNSGGGALSFGASAASDLGWLKLTGSGSGTATPSGPASVGFTADPTGLNPGVYTGAITVTDAGSGQSASVRVTLTVSGSGAIQLSQSGMTFTAVAGGAVPPAQTFTVTAPGSWTVAASSSGWLKASASGSAVTVSANQNGLSAGTYYGSVNVGSQTVTVSLNVTARSSGVTVSSGGLLFTGSGSQTVTLFNPAAGPTTYSSSLYGGSWLSVGSSSGILTSGANAFTVSVSAVPSGVQTGSVTLSFGDGSSAAIQVVAIGGLAAHASNCNGAVGVVRLPVSGAALQVASPQPVQAQVVDGCGNPVTAAGGGSVQMTFSDADPSVDLHDVGGGVWEATWTPANAANAVTAQVLPSGASVTVSVQAAAAGAAGQVTGVANAAGAGQAVPGVVAPMSYVAIYGTGLAGAGAGSATQLPLPTTLNGTQLLLGGLPMPLLYAGPGQVNALAPEGLAANGTYPLVVVRGATQSVPVPVTVAAVAPGVYTVDTSGSGAGIVTNALTGALITAANPAHAGDYLAVYCTGLGAVTGPNGEAEPGDGAAAPAGLIYSVGGKVTATIGGVSAPVTFAGLTPGFAGLYQVNVQVPGGVAAGSAVNLVISVVDGSGAVGKSNAVGVAIQ